MAADLDLSEHVNFTTCLKALVTYPFPHLYLPSSESFSSPYRCASPTLTNISGQMQKEQTAWIHYICLVFRTSYDSTLFSSTPTLTRTVTRLNIASIPGHVLNFTQQSSPPAQAALHQRSSLWVYYSISGKHSQTCQMVTYRYMRSSARIVSMHHHQIHDPYI